jgi:predicted nucleic acid-binding protein
MTILVDSNILLRSVQTHHSHYAMVEQAFAVLRGANETLNVVAQNFIEFWAVAKRPAGKENGLGMTCEAVTKEVAVIKGLFRLLPEPAAIFGEWERLVTTHQISGRRVHDARLVAAMNLHGLKRILTFNVADFARYAHVEAIHPQSV